MNYSQIKVLALIGLFSFFLQSCSKDSDLAEINNFSGGQQSNGGGGGQGPDVDFPLDNSVATQWMTLFLELDRYAYGMRPNATARALAYINLAAYETAVPGMRGFSSNDRHIPGLNLQNNNNLRNINWEVALNACYADVMDHFLFNLPSDKRPQISQLETTLGTDFGEGLSEQEINRSNEWGSTIASKIIEFSQTDDAAEAQILEPQPLSYEPPTGDGYWTYSAEQERGLFPYWKDVRTFIVKPNQTTTIAPVAYSEDPNSNYYQQMLEVYEANNNAKAEDNEELWIAEFWSDDVENLVFSPPARQISIANQVVLQKDTDLDETLYLYLKLGFSLNDAAVSTWKYKYQYMVMRPNVFIHEFIDPSFQTNLYRLIPWPNPTFPGYPSGHSCFASAAAGVFIDFFGNEIDFTDESHKGRTEFRGTPRSFNSFRDIATENGYSRIPLGVHVRMDCTEGLRLGYEISDGINDYQLRRREG